MTILTGVALGESLSVARKSRSRQYNLFLQEGGNLLLINTVVAAHKSGVFILVKYPLGESWPHK